MDDDTDSRQVLSIAVLEPDLRVAGSRVPGSEQRSLAMKGSLCTQSARIVAAALNRWLDGAPGEETAVDLSGLHFIDARGLSLLISLRHRATVGGGSLTIVRTSQAVDRFSGCAASGSSSTAPQAQTWQGRLGVPALRCGRPPAGCGHRSCPAAPSLPAPRRESTGRGVSDAPPHPPTNASLKSS